MEKNIENETLKIALQGEIYPSISSQASNIITPEEKRRINENDQFAKNGLEQIHRIQYCTSQMLLWNFDEISLEKLKKVKTSVKRYSTKIIEICDRLKGYRTFELGNCAITPEELEKARLPTMELWDRLCDEIWKRRFISLQIAVFLNYKKKATTIYNNFNQKNDQLWERLRNGHQRFDYVLDRNAEKLRNLEKSTRNLIREKILQIDSDKNLCKNFREIKEIISKAVFEASKISYSHFSLINKSLGKYIKPRKFFPIFRVKKVKQAYYEKAYKKRSISKITALNENKIVNEKKWTSKICEINQFVKNIVASSSMKYNWKYRKKFIL